MINPVNESLVFKPYASSACSDQPVHLHRLARSSLLAYTKLGSRERLRTNIRLLVLK